MSGPRNPKLRSSGGCSMSTVTFAPLFRSSIGFDRFSDLFETALRSETGSSYPTYNVEKHGDDDYRIVVAASGFAEGDQIGRAHVRTPATTAQLVSRLLLYTKITLH